MKKWLIFLLVLLVPLIISGCFGFLKKSQPLDNEEPEIKGNYEVFRNQTLGEAAYEVRYPNKWKISELTNGRFATATDEVIFKVGKVQEISLLVFPATEEAKILNSYNIETQSQTEVSRFLGTRIIGQHKETKNQEEVLLVVNGDFLYVFKTNQLDSLEFIDFLNNITIINNLNVMVTPVESLPTYKLYFKRVGVNETDCQAIYYREVYLSLPEEELALIPNVIKALLSPEKLKLQGLGLVTTIPAGTRLLSFGYDNNKAIVNFSSQLNQGGGSPSSAGGAGSCEMAMRRSQIEKTIKALNEVSNLEIKEVEIQVEGDSGTALQP